MSPLTVLLAPPSDALRKMVSPQMIGVEPLQAGICSFHVTFSSTVHLTGRFFSLLTPLSAGPRHCGQLSAETMLNAATVDRAMMTNTSVNRRRMFFRRESLGTRRFNRAVAYGRPVIVPQRAWGRMRRIASDNHSTQARRLRGRLIPINTPFPRLRAGSDVYPGAMFIFSWRRSLLLNDSSNDRSISGDMF